MERLLALDDIAKAVEAEPDRVDLRRRYGILLFRRGRFAEAAREFAQWVRRATRDPEGFLFLARALARIGMQDHAATAVKLSLSLDPANPRGRQLLRRLSVEEPQPGGAWPGPASSTPLDETPGKRKEDATPPTPLSFGGAFFSGRTLSVTAAPLQKGGGDASSDRLNREKSARVAARSDLRGWFNAWIDKFMAFLALERGLILRIFVVESQKSALGPFTKTLQVILAIVMHSLLFWMLEKRFPGSISYVGFTLGGFVMWKCFALSKEQAVPADISGRFNKSANIKWIHLVIASYVLVAILVAFAAVVTATTFWLIGNRALSDGLIVPNIPWFLGVMAIAMSLGLGAGLVLHAFESRWATVTAVEQIMMWLLYVTSGIFQSYVQWPGFVEAIIKYNPMLTILEYSRLTIDKTYDVGDLTLSYPISLAAVLIFIGLILRKWDPVPEPS